MSRDVILSAIPAASTEANRSREAGALLERRGSLRPDFGAEVEQRFILRVTSPQLTGTLDKATGAEGIVNAVHGYFDQHHLHNHRLINFSSLDDALFHARDLSTARALDPNEMICLSEAQLGVAETGSLVFLSSEDRPTLSSYLPLHHLVLLRQDRLVGFLDEIIPALGLEPDAFPRNINLVTGTSGTADIEAKNVRGAHGPRYLHVILYN